MTHNQIMDFAGSDSELLYEIPSTIINITGRRMLSQLGLLNGMQKKSSDLLIPIKHESTINVATHDWFKYVNVMLTHV
jgi:hypothetical protein